MLVRLRVLWQVLRGRPVMYRMRASMAGTFTFTSTNAFVAECVFDRSAV